MTLEEIKESILDIFTEVYNVKYIGTLKVERLNPIGLSVRLGIMNDYKPMYISAELDDISFLKYFKRELYDRNLDMVEFFKGVVNYPDECVIDSRCSCHE